MRESDLNNNQTLLISKKDSSSRYYFTNYVKNQDSKITYDLFTRISYEEDENITYHTVTILEQNRIDKISNLVYGTTKYWWLIALANNIIDPFIIIPGTTLKIPTITSFIQKGLLNG